MIDNQPNNNNDQNKEITQDQYKRCGWLFKRGHVRKNWKKRYFVFDEKKLTIAYKKNEKMGSSFIKIIQLKLYRLEHEVIMDEKNKFSFCLQHTTRPKENLLLYSEFKEEYHAWIDTLQIFVPAYNGIQTTPSKTFVPKQQALNSKEKFYSLPKKKGSGNKRLSAGKDPVFSKSIEVVFEEKLKSEEIIKGKLPAFLEKIFSALYQQSAITTKGIFRLSGSNEDISKLRDCIEFSIDINYAQEDIHAISGLLKSYIREIPEPLCMFKYYEYFLSGVKLEEEKKKLYYHNLIFSLPIPNRTLLSRIVKMIILYASFSDENAMTLENLCRVFAPNIIRTKKEALGQLVDTPKTLSAMLFLVQEYNFIFTPFENQEEDPFGKLLEKIKNKNNPNVEEEGKEDVKENGTDKKVFDNLEDDKEQVQKIQNFLNIYTKGDSNSGSVDILKPKKKPKKKLFVNKDITISDMKKSISEEILGDDWSGESDEIPHKKSGSRSPFTTEESSDRSLSSKRIRGKRNRRSKNSNTLPEATKLDMLRQRFINRKSRSYQESLTKFTEVLDESSNSTRDNSTRENIDDDDNNDSSEKKNGSVSVPVKNGEDQPSRPVNSPPPRPNTGAPKRPLGNAPPKKVGESIEEIPVIDKSPVSEHKDTVNSLKENLVIENNVVVENKEITENKNSEIIENKISETIENNNNNNNKTNTDHNKNDEEITEKTENTRSEKPLTENTTEKLGRIEEEDESDSEEDEVESSDDESVQFFNTKNNPRFSILMKSKEDIFKMKENTSTILVNHLKNSAEKVSANGDLNGSSKKVEDPVKKISENKTDDLLNDDPNKEIASPLEKDFPVHIQNLNYLSQDTEDEHTSSYRNSLHLIKKPNEINSNDESTDHSSEFSDNPKNSPNVNKLDHSNVDSNNQNEDTDSE